MIVPRKTPAAEVAKVLAGVAPGTVRSVTLFDVYEGAGIPDGHRSLAFTVTFGGDLLSPSIMSGSAIGSTVRVFSMTSRSTSRPARFWA